MSKRVIVSLVVMAGLAIAGGLLWTGATRAAAEFQRDADIVRLRHLKDLGGWIAEYAAKEGRYPFQGTESVPVYVVLATPEQMPKERLPFAHTLKSPSEFSTELERVLGRKLAMRFDPQRAASGAPNFYLYAVEGTTFNLAVHLHGDFPFAQKLGPTYSKLGVSNVPKPALHIWRYEDLIQHAPFVEAAGRTLLKPGFFEKHR